MNFCIEAWSEDPIFGFQAISTKESLLIGNMALDLDITEAEAPTPIRIVSPTEQSPNNTDDNQHLDLNNLEFGEDQELQVFAKSQDNINSQNDCNSHEESFSKKMLTGVDNVQDLREISAYEDFMTHLDQQLNKIEKELETFLRFSNMLLENKEKPEYSKVQHATEILEAVCHIRER